MKTTLATSQYVEALRYHGLRVTKGRVLVSNFLGQVQGSFTAKDVYESINQANDLDFVTVRRILKIFALHALVHPIDSTTSFVVCKNALSTLSSKVHVLLKCDHCENVDETFFEEDAIKSLEQKIQSHFPVFQPRNRILAISGLCNRCQYAS